MMESLYRLVNQVLQPHTLLHLLTAAGLVFLWCRKAELRKALLWVLVPFAGLTLINLPVVAYFALGSLEWAYPPRLQRPANAQAIVILAGGIQYVDGVRTQPELDFDTMRRCVRGAEVYHSGEACPVVVTGGPEVPGGPPPALANVMRDLLLMLGVAESDILLEDQSRTTFENAVECRRVLAPRGITRIVLVTDATHMYRSLRCFSAQGFDVIPSACAHGATHFTLQAEAFLPNPGAAQNCRRVFHEWMGLAWYRLKGRI
jgi:uncharacterized SAM-binding protein YcdF (DUF218 family)